ncbi:hypothetical protein [Acetobacter indonesiensis]|uniref:hypothetical protein n=1 Tax=Acetobacter indonesiensis TaxID=104101 RepID=UPI0020A48FE2|nr:hypothetical protein [Acetobacter indonesiensis]MCP1232066.1 hypothetical protein [Acetobacter indonesiensis]
MNEVHIPRLGPAHEQTDHCGAEGFRCLNQTGCCGVFLHQFVAAADVKKKVLLLFDSNLKSGRQPCLHGNAIVTRWQWQPVFRIEGAGRNTLVVPVPISQ